MNLFFDLDGTLTDSRVGIVRCIAYALERMNVAPPPAESLERYIGPSLYDSFAELLPAADRPSVEQAVAHYRDRYTDTGIFENRLYDGIAAVLEQLAAAGHTLLIVTTKPTVFARRIAGHFGLAGHFRDIVGANLDGSRSAKAELIGHALSSHLLHPRDCVMIGDRRDDMVGARAAGVAAVGVLWGFGSEEELESAGAEALCARPVDLPAAIGVFGRERR